MTTAAITSIATGNLSNVQAFTADELGTELAAATARMHGSRHNRSGIVYTDAKTAVAVLAAETRRREQVSDVDFVELFRTQAGQHAAVRDALIPASKLRVRTDPARQCGIECTGAAGTEICTCECGGRNHGLLHRARPVSTPESQARAWARLPAVSDDEPF